MANHRSGSIMNVLVTLGTQNMNEHEHQAGETIRCHYESLIDRHSKRKCS